MEIKKPILKAETPKNTERRKGERQTPVTLGFRMVKVVPGGKGKARMEKRDI